MAISMQLCNQLARIVGGSGSIVNGACLIQRFRSNLNLRIQRRRSKSPLTIPFFLSAESRDARGNTLNLGETVILESEINTFVRQLRNRGITVSALHNHWLFQNTPFKYIHWQNVGDPVTFARNSVAAARAAGILPRQ